MEKGRCCSVLTSIACTFILLLVIVESTTATGHHYHRSGSRSTRSEPASTPVLEILSCFNGVLDIQCQKTDVIVFESARYGRNDSMAAVKCHTVFQANCEVDVHFILNSKCAGRSSCTLPVNTATFDDPCGYEEFLLVRYICLPQTQINQQCQQPPEGPGISLFERGYVASPNYPRKYFQDGECVWHVTVQRRQTIDIILYDFELSVKRNGRCYDFLEISTTSSRASSGDVIGGVGNAGGAPVTLYRECGLQGKVHIEVPTNHVTIRFKTGHTSLAQRGFILNFRAVGPGCEDLDPFNNGEVSYAIANDILTANISCYSGYIAEGVEPAMSFLVLTCLGSQWDKTVTQCIVPPTTSTAATLLQTSPLASMDTEIPEPEFTLFASARSTLGVILGVLSALLFIVLLLVLVVYFRRRKSRGRQNRRRPDKWHVVVNNLQEMEMNEENTRRLLLASSPNDHVPGSGGKSWRHAHLSSSSGDRKSNSLLDSGSHKQLVMMMEDDEDSATYALCHMKQSTGNQWPDHNCGTPDVCSNLDRSGGREYDDTASIKSSSRNRRSPARNPGSRSGSRSNLPRVASYRYVTSPNKALTIAAAGGGRGGGDMVTTGSCNNHRSPPKTHSTSSLRMSSQKRRSRSGLWETNSQAARNNALMAATAALPATIVVRPVDMSASVAYDRDDDDIVMINSCMHRGGLTQSAPDLFDLGSNSGDSGIELGREHLCGQCGRDIVQVAATARPAYIMTSLGPSGSSRGDAIDEQLSMREEVRPQSSNSNSNSNNNNNNYPRSLSPLPPPPPPPQFLLPCDAVSDSNTMLTSFIVPSSRGSDLVTKAWKEAIDAQL